MEVDDREHQVQRRATAGKGPTLRPVDAADGYLSLHTTVEFSAVVDMIEERSTRLAAEAVRRHQAERNLLSACIRVEGYQTEAGLASCSCVANADATLKAAGSHLGLPTGASPVTGR
eukprot:GHVR01147239.1.p2 GENE.GHVR01147239.1~~GHVR01147239.1.p2  ORF type:complete len:117 (+),score=20.60 GHVR01147239.1:87-437(+)